MKNQHGGKREGSGRKKSDPSISIQFLVPKELAEGLKKDIKVLIQLRKNPPINSN